jgi:hypothetical protein
MSPAYHPQTDGASEHMNKTLNQCVHFHVECNQKGWAWALPIIHFNIMNSVNASTSFSKFQIHMGHSPRAIPLLVQGVVSDDTSEDTAACSIIAQIENDICKAKDALLGAKIIQAFFANKSHGPEDHYVISDCVMLATLYHH